MWKTRPSCQNVVNKSLDTISGNITFHKSGEVCKIVYGCILVLKECIAQAEATSLLYANILFQLALFNHAFSFLNDAQIAQSRNGRITSTCQQGVFISQRDKCGRTHVNLSQDFSTSLPFQTHFLYVPASHYSTAYSVSVPFQAVSIHKNFVKNKEIVFPELADQAGEKKTKKKDQIQPTSFITPY